MYTSQAAAAVGPIALIGGGRWGRVLFEVLDTLLPTGCELLWVSVANEQAIADQLVARPAARTVRLLNSTDAALERAPSAVVVATAPHSHATLTRRAIDAGADVLVEKPLALHSAEARELTDLAEAQGRLLAVNLEFRTAPFLSTFARRLTGRSIRRIEIDWQDPLSEQRYGALKRADLLTPICWDICPHIWSICKVLLPDCELELKRVERNPDGIVELEFECEAVTLCANLHRRAQQRIRRISVASSDGGLVELDFTTEPGQLRVNGMEVEMALPGLPRPLATSLSGFLDARARAYKNFALSAQQCLGSVSSAEKASARLRECDGALLRRLLGHSDADCAPLDRLLLDNLLPVLARRDLALARRVWSAEDLWLARLRVQLPALLQQLPSQPELLFEVLADHVVSGLELGAHRVQGENWLTGPEGLASSL